MVVMMMMMKMMMRMVVVEAVGETVTTEVAKIVRVERRRENKKKHIRACLYNVVLQVNLTFL